MTAESPSSLWILAAFPFAAVLLILGSFWRRRKNDSGPAAPTPAEAVLRLSSGTIARRRASLVEPTFDVAVQDGPGTPLRTYRVVDLGDLTFDLEVVDTAPHRDEIRRAVDGRPPGVPANEFPALLVPELSRPENLHAVAVWAVDGRRIGYLSRFPGADWQASLIRLFNSCNVHVTCRARVDADSAGGPSRVKLDVRLSTVRELLDRIQNASDERMRPGAGPR